MLSASRMACQTRTSMSVRALATAAVSPAGAPRARRCGTLAAWQQRKPGEAGQFVALSGA